MSHKDNDEHELTKQMPFFQYYSLSNMKHKDIIIKECLQIVFNNLSYEDITKLRIVKMEIVHANDLITFHNRWLPKQYALKGKLYVNSKNQVKCHMIIYDYGKTTEEIKKHAVTIIKRHARKTLKKLVK